MAESKGVWFDSKKNKVVESPPEEGVQLVAPGDEMDDAAKALVERYKASYADPKRDVDLSVTETATQKTPVETATTSKRSSAK